METTANPELEKATSKSKEKSLTYYSGNGRANPYRTLHEFFTKHGVVKRKTANWRLVDESVAGEINGLENSYGVLIATDGVLCLIEQRRELTTESTLFEGHLDWFVPHKPSQKTVTTSDGRVHQVGVKARKEAQVLIAQRLMNDLLNM